MKIRFLKICLISWLGLSLLGNICLVKAASIQTDPPQKKVQEQSTKNKKTDEHEKDLFQQLYRQAKEALYQQKWAEAIKAFQQLVKQQEKAASTYLDESYYLSLIHI